MKKSILRPSPSSAVRRVEQPGRRGRATSRNATHLVVLFPDLGLLFDITTAYSFDWDVADPVILAQHLPERTWSEMNRDTRDERFNLSDVNIAVLQFNHDRIDYDGDGLFGNVEIDCTVMNGVHLTR